MNLVKMIEDQLSGETLDKLSSVIGTDPDTTGRAASAAIPTLLASLANLGSNEDGVRKLSGVLSGIDVGSLGNVAQMLGGDANSLLNKGMSMLGSLFGDNMINSAAAAIGRYAGLDAVTVKKLIAFVAPMVLGKMAAQWKSQGGTPGALTNLLGEQKRYIPDSLPAGFSLDNVPGLAGAKDAVGAASHTTRRAAETAERAAPSMMSRLLPLAALLLGAFLLWQFLKPGPERNPVSAQKTSTAGDRVTAMKPEVPEMPNIPSMTQLTDELNATFKTMGETFASIKDAASAEAAAPKLDELSTKIDTIKKMMAQLPESGRATLQKVVDDQLNPIKEQAQQVLELPGLSERIKTLIGQIVRKLEEWRIIEPTG